MSTLHLCHWQNQEHVNQHLSLMAKDDCLIIYGDLNKKNIDTIMLFLSSLEPTWYIVTESLESTFNDRLINHHEWLQLLIKYNNSYAWK